jgi:hypothetical protein
MKHLSPAPQAERTSACAGRGARARRGSSMSFSTPLCRKFIELQGGDMGQKRGGRRLDVHVHDSSTSGRVSPNPAKPIRSGDLSLSRGCVPEPGTCQKSGAVCTTPFRPIYH